MIDTTMPSKLTRQDVIGWAACGATAIGIFIFMVQTTTFFMAIAALNFYMLTIGILYRRQRKLHVSLMLTGICFDLALVLTLQIMRNAVQTAASFELSLLPQMHIGASSIATALYFPVLYLGIQRFRGIAVSRKWHLRLGITAYIFRTLGFLLMFSMFK